MNSRGHRGPLIAAAVNYTDLKIRAGVWPVRKANPFPYTPGVEFVTVDADALAPVPADVDPLAMAAMGLAGVTVLGALGRIGPIAGKGVRVTLDGTSLRPAVASLAGWLQTGAIGVAQYSTCPLEQAAQQGFAVPPPQVSPPPIPPISTNCCPCVAKPATLCVQFA